MPQLRSEPPCLLRKILIASTDQLEHDEPRAPIRLHALIAPASSGSATLRNLYIKPKELAEHAALDATADHYLTPCKGPKLSASETLHINAHAINMSTIAAHPT